MICKCTWIHTDQEMRIIAMLRSEWYNMANYRLRIYIWLHKFDTVLRIVIGWLKPGVGRAVLATLLLQSMHVCQRDVAVLHCKPATQPDCIIMPPLVKHHISDHIHLGWVASKVDHSWDEMVKQFKTAAKKSRKMKNYYYGFPPAFVLVLGFLVECIHYNS